MALEKRIGLGVVLQYSDNNETYTDLATVVDSITGDASGTDVNTSLLGQTFDSFERGSVDPGTWETVIAYDPLEDTNEDVEELWQSGAKKYWRLMLPQTATSLAVETDGVLGYISGAGVEVQKNNMLTRKLTIKKSDDTGFGGDAVGS